MLEQAKRLADIYSSLDDYVAKINEVFGAVPWPLFEHVHEIPSVIFALIDVEDDDPAYYALEDYLKSDKRMLAFEAFVRDAKYTD